MYRSDRRDDRPKYDDRYDRGRYRRDRRSMPNVKVPQKEVPIQGGGTRGRRRSEERMRDDGYVDKRRRTDYRAEYMTDTSCIL